MLKDPVPRQKHSPFPTLQFVPIGAGLLTLLFASVSWAQIEITLTNTFIDTFKDRATITATYTVDKAHAQSNPPAKDGDLHIAGRAPEIGLATVAEIINSKFEPAAVKSIHDVEGTDTTVAITGAWRLWCEHGGHDSQIQGAPLERFTTTNPPHVFEIHPITKIDDRDIADGWRQIVGFQSKDAATAFAAYENRTSQIKPGSDTTTITTNIVGYNYVEFLLKPNEEAHEIDDGLQVNSNALDLDGNPVATNRRMVFVKGTPPGDEAKNLKPGGSSLHVLGVPRIDLSLVAWRRDHATDRPDALNWNLPYEIVIVAVYPAHAAAVGVHHRKARTTHAAAPPS